MQGLDAQRARRILIAQAIVTLVIMALTGLLFGYREGLFALIGGIIATSANALFAYWVFGRYRAAEPGKLAAQFYGAELLKLAFIALAFAVVIIGSDPLSPLALFGAFFVVQVLPPLLANRIAG